MRLAYGALALIVLTASAFAVPHAELPIFFEPNTGQTAPEVRYVARAQSMGLWLLDSGAVLRVGSENKQAVLKMSFDGARRHPRMEGEEPLAAHAGYFIGNDPAKWRTGVPLFGEVLYRDVYPGIDLRFHGDSAALEYDWILHPGADPRAIRMSFRGADKVTIGEDGDLLLAIGGLELRHKKPELFQDGRTIDGRFVRRGHTIGFEVASYDHARALTIDPALSYASYLGGSGADSAAGVAVDPQGNLLIAGTTASANFPGKNSVLETQTSAAQNAFVAKINPNAPGQGSLFWVAFLGGTTGWSGGTAIASDSESNVLIAGYTQANDFPTRNAFQVAFASSNQCTSLGLSGVCPDGFIAKFDPSGYGLLYSSFLGGNAFDAPFSVVADAAGDAYVSGYTSSSNFPATPRAYQTTLHSGLLVGSNGFVTEVDPSGVLLYSTYLGGEANDFIYGSALDSQGNLYVVGQTSSKFFPTLNAFQPALAAASDGFVAKLNTSLPHTQGLVYSTYLGGSGGNSVFYGAATDSQGHVYAVGGTNAGNYPVTASALEQAISGAPNSGDPNPFGLVDDAVITELNPSAAGAAQLVYSTFLGGAGYNTAYSVALDSQGKLMVAGATDAATFPVTQDGFDQDNAAIAFQTKAFLTRLDPTARGAAGLLYSTYFGGGANDGPTATSRVAVATDATGVSIVGATFSPNMAATAQGYQTGFGGGSDADAFVARFDMTKTAPAIIQIASAASYLSAAPAAAPGEVVTLFGTNLGPAAITGPVLDSSGRLATTVAGCQVLVNGIAAPIVYASALQTSVILPYELASVVDQNQAAVAQVICNGVRGGVFPLRIIDAAPAIFTRGSGEAAVLNADGSVNSAANPAAKGSLVQIFATGEGVLSPAGADGRIESGPVSSIPKPVLPVGVTFGGIASPNVAYAGVAPDSVDGLLQVNAEVPGSAPSGNVAIVLSVGPFSSQGGLAIAVK